MDKILVTGGAGFIGSNFIRSWLEREAAHVINLDCLTYAGNLDSLDSLPHADRHHFVQGDIGDDKLVTELLQKHQPFAIVNFAAESHVDRSIDGPDAFVQTNVMGTFRLLECARHHYAQLTPKQRDVFRFLHVSTDEVFGSLGPTGLFTETSQYSPNSPYSASKAASDHFVRAYGHTYGLPVLITNCSNNYGPYQFPEKLIPLMILNAIEGRPLPVYGDGLQVRDWLYVEDHCTAIREVLNGGALGETYNIGGNCERTNLDVVTTICQAVDARLPAASKSRESLIKFVEDRPGHDRRYAIDATKIRDHLGWQPSETFETGLRKTVDWYFDNSTWCERVTSGKYRRERLGQA